MLGCVRDFKLDFERKYVFVTCQETKKHLLYQHVTHLHCRKVIFPINFIS